MSFFKLINVIGYNRAHLAHVYHKPGLILITHQNICLLPMNLIIEQQHKNIIAFFKVINKRSLLKQVEVKFDLKKCVKQIR